MIQQKDIIWAIAGLLMLASCNRPISQFIFDQEEPKAPTTINFVNQSEKADSFYWDFGDGTKSTDLNPSHRYLKSGSYTVVLSASNGKKARMSEQSIVVDPPGAALVELQTAHGNMLVELYDETPQHRDNFMKLASEGFYDSLLFHRVIQGFMIQGGDPDSRGARRGARLGMGGPGYQIPAEISKDLVHLKGALSAARTGDAVNPEKKSSGSQFYIVQGQPMSEDQLKMFERRKGLEYTDEQVKIYSEQGGTPFLDMEYTVFGRVIEGLDVIDKIAEVQTDGADRPVENVTMKAVTIE